MDVLPAKGDNVTVYQLTIQNNETDNTISKFVIKLGRSKFGYPELTMITRAKKDGKKRTRSLQSIPIDPSMWEKKTKKGKKRVLHTKEPVAALNQE